MDSDLTSSRAQSFAAPITGPEDGGLLPFLNAPVGLCRPGQLHASFSYQREEVSSPIRSTSEIVQVSAWRQFQRDPSTTKDRSEVLRGLAAAPVRVQDAKDDARPRQPAQAIRREIGPARAECRQIPAHGCQPVKSTFDQKYFSLARGAFEAQDWFFTRQAQVFDAHFLAGRVSPQEPDGLAAAQFGNNYPTREPFAQHSSEFAGLGAPQEAELLCNAQTPVLAQVRLERATIGEAKAASANDPVRQPALGQVRASARISP